MTSVYVAVKKVTEILYGKLRKRRTSGVQKRSLYLSLQLSELKRLSTETNNLNSDFLFILIIIHFLSNTFYPPFECDNCYSARRPTPCQANEMFRSYVAGKQRRTNLSRNQVKVAFKPPKTCKIAALRFKICVA